MRKKLGNPRDTLTIKVQIKGFWFGWKQPVRAKGGFFETIVVVNFLESLPRKQQPVEKLKR